MASPGIYIIQKMQYLIGGSDAALVMAGISYILLVAYMVPFCLLFLYTADGLGIKAGRSANRCFEMILETWAFKYANSGYGWIKLRVSNFCMNPMNGSDSDKLPAPIPAIDEKTQPFAKFGMVIGIGATVLLLLSSGVSNRTVPFKETLIGGICPDIIS
jgi:hypothetical protein